MIMYKILKIIYLPVNYVLITFKMDGNVNDILVGRTTKFSNKVLENFLLIYMPVLVQF